MGQKLFALMREGPEDQLTLTENAQAAIMAVSLAAARGCWMAISASRARGRNTWPATASANIRRTQRRGTFSLRDTARLLKIRGQAMQRAVPVGVGAMAVLIGKADLELAEKACEAGASAGVVVIANDNNAARS